VFSSLIGGAGIYAVTPVGTRFVWGGCYEHGSLIWRSRWMTTEGVVECREALAFPSEVHRAVILRRVMAVDGPARVRVVLDARADFGRRPMTDHERDRGVWTAQTGPLRLRWSGAARARRNRDGAFVHHVELQPGEHHDLVLEISDRKLNPEPIDAQIAWDATEAGWASAVPDLPDSIARRDSRHAYAVLRGLTASGGGMVAAATMCLPERADAGRNYDYRYAWIRDQCYAGQAAAVSEPDPLLDDAVTFIAERLLADGPDLKPAYRVDGGLVPKERRLSHLSSYPGGGTKLGNSASRQFQLDAFGEALLLFASAARHDRLDSERWRAVEAAVDAIERRWQDPDAGIWELEERHWTHSRLICVAGLRAIAPAASTGEAARWISLADEIAADAGANGVHPSGRWQRAVDDDRVDAALLLAAIRGAVPAGDPRSKATLAAVADELGREGYVYRFRHDPRPLEDAEGAFVLCGFLMALATHQAGRPTEARAWFERGRSACGPPGLFTEEFDVRQRQLRGNLPQAFCHALFLECAARLSRSRSAT
jgi:GH15 family glucan-1,4-alpha-glucosidase